MGKKEVKIEKQMTTGETVKFLQTLADTLAGKKIADSSVYGIDHKDIKKIKMHLKKEGSLFELKMKAKYSLSSHESEAVDTGKSITFKTLKKEMKHTFKILKTSIDGGSMPASETVDAFIQQAELMVSFKDLGYGDEYHEEFLKLCHEFKDTFGEGHFDKLVTAYNNIDARKALCHDKYD